MGLISWVLLGLIAGSIAKAILPGRVKDGCLPTLALGVGGAVLGGWLGSQLFNVGLGTFWSLKTWLVAVAGSVVVL
ncbi:MAG: GlsB/YeaQ/YmgE family stress response membrane protein, partial [Propionibacteriaceae bacterium]|nr:GlsB/YeaQ/YmgE family stress response membrane protein [Propionibacteriaceae bacterium]